MDKNNSGSKNSVFPTDRERWIAALSYVVFLCFFSLWKSKNNAYIKYHASQGFLLFFSECIAFIVIVILEITIGNLRFIGLIFIGIAQLFAGLGALTLSVLGFVKALFGEYWHLPVLGDFREKIPGMH